MTAEELLELEKRIRAAKFTREEFPVPCGLPQEIYPQLEGHPKANTAYAWPLQMV